jgi:hypothetical protein
MDKVFCIGMNKTGTTSLKFEFIRLKYNVAPQREIERKFWAYNNEKWEVIIDYCKGYDFFQDFPFSFPNTYKEIDKVFGSKFILTIRNSADDWYDSLIRFHKTTGAFNSNGKLPTANNLKDAIYIRKGWMYDTHMTLFDVTDTDLYNKEKLVKAYNDYNNEVINYFGDRDDFLVLNLSEGDSYSKFIKFLNVDSPHSEFLHLNKSK